MNAPVTEPHPSRPLPGPFASQKPAQTHTGPRGALYCYRVAPDVVFAQVVGHLDVEGAKVFMAFADPLLGRSSPVDMFHDWEDMTSYDSDARTALTKWTVDRRESLGTAVFLVTSKIVAMGVATANVATSPIGVTLHSHTERAAFEKAFLDRLQGR